MKVKVHTSAVLQLKTYCQGLFSKQLNASDKYIKRAPNSHPLTLRFLEFSCHNQRLLLDTVPFQETTLTWEKSILKVVINFFMHSFSYILEMFASMLSEQSIIVVRLGSKYASARSPVIFQTICYLLFTIYYLKAEKNKTSAV